MWTAINKLFLLVRRSGTAAVARGATRVLRATAERRPPVPGCGRRDDAARRAVRVHRARPPSRACGEDGARRGRPLSDCSLAPLRCADTLGRAERPPGVLQRIRGLRAAGGHAFEPWPIAEYLVHSEASRGRRSTVSRPACTQSNGFARATVAAAPLARAVVRRARVRGVVDTSGNAVQASMHRLLAGIQRSERRSRRPTSRAGRCPRARSRSRRDSNSNVDERRARHHVLVRQRDQRGVHGDPPSARAQRGSVAPRSSFTPSLAGLPSTNTRIASATPSTSSTSSSRTTSSSCGCAPRSGRAGRYAGRDRAGFARPPRLPPATRYVPLEGP